jgi:hypothetical protein
MIKMCQDTNVELVECSLFHLTPDNESTIFLQNVMNHSHTVSHSRRLESQQHSSENLKSFTGLPCCIYLIVSFPGQSLE